MKGKLLLSFSLMAAILLVGAVAARAVTSAGSAQAHDSVTVSGIWSSVQWYEAGGKFGCYSGVGDPQVYDWKTHPQDNTPVDLSTNASDSYGWASSKIKVWAPGLVPTIAIHSWGNVHDVPASIGHWGSAYSEGSANCLTSGATQTVTVRIDYSYDLDLTHAGTTNPFAFAKIYVAFWDPSGNLMLTPKDEFVLEGNYLIKTVRIDTPGSKTGTVTGSETWPVNVTNGSLYSFWSMAWGEVWTYGEPIGIDQSTWGRIKSMFR
jgi:hypothetical protein